MSLKEFTSNRWTKFIFWTLLYLAWVIWLGNYWWLFGLVVIFDIFITRKVHWNFWKKRYKEGEKHSAWNEWLDAIVFAVIVVSFLNIFFFQAFKIPSSSMESSLYTGDHLFVSKLSYGPRVVQTPLTIPFTHNVFLGKESYTTLIHRDYRRLKGFGQVKRGDCVVFNFPNGDTVLRSNPALDYYALVRIYGREAFAPEDLIVRPADKTDHYVKRCVAVAGDVLEVKDGLVWVNGEQQEVYPGVQLSYAVLTNGQRINSKTLSRLGIKETDCYYDPNLPGYRAMPLTSEQLDRVKTLPNVVSVHCELDRNATASSKEIFPYSDAYGWTRDYFGPLEIPSKGKTVKLDSVSLPLYERLISVYEKSDLQEALRKGEYTFKQDYYFMMGDNRHNSLDSRYWGFVPEDHIVGKPFVIWFSSDGEKKFPKNIRWGRIFKFV